MQDDSDAQAVIERLRQRETVLKLDVTGIIGLVADAANYLLPVMESSEFGRALGPAYSRFVDLVPLHARVRVVLSDAERIERREVPVDRLKLFMLMDDESFVAATAATEFVRMAPLIDGDPQSRAREVVETILPHARSPGAVFGGMVSVGDRRLTPLLLETTASLSSPKLQIAAHCNSGQPIVGRLEFWLTMLDRCIDEQNRFERGDPEWFYWESYIGAALSGLERIVTTAQTDEIVDAETEFGYPFFDPPREPLRRLETVPLTQIGHRYAERFWAVERREAVPRAMPYVMGLYGVEPRSPEEERWEPPTPGSDEELWEDDDDEAAFDGDGDETTPPQRITWLDRLFFFLGRR